MQKEISFHTKTLKELSTYEILKLRQLCLPYGVFKIILRDLATKRISKPEMITVTIAKKEKYQYVGWLLEDCAKEYNPDLEPDHCSLHVYSAPQMRLRGVGAQMFENRLTELRKHARLWAYVRDAEPEVVFYNKMNEKFDLKIQITSPVLYCGNRKKQ